ncbi:hypothetical protein COOONC_13376 [Cooperia oncophora]
MRKSVALGQQVNVDELLPTASNMYKLKWSCLLEGEVYERLNRCDSNHEPLRRFGFNVNSRELHNVNLEDTPTNEFREILREWWSVLEEHRLSERDSSEEPERFQNVDNVSNAILNLHG